MKKDVIIHLDADAFASSVSCALDPSLRGKPVIVGNDAGGRGVVTCASYEARKSGAHSGMPLGIAKRRFPCAVFLPENPAEYEKFSAKLFDLLTCHAPAVEVATMDDFYLDVSGCERLFGGNMSKWVRNLARSVKLELGIPISIGMAPNKMVARIATCMAKPAHVLEILPGMEADFIAPIDVRFLPGIGAQSVSRLREMGVRKIGQLALMGEDMLRIVFGPQGSEICQRASGVFHEPVKPTELHRLITEEHIFQDDTADPTKLEAVVSLLAQRLATQLRQYNVRTKSVRLLLVYNDGLSTTHNARLEYPSNHDIDFLQPVSLALEKTFRRRVRVRRVNLEASFIPCEDAQFDILRERGIRKRAALYSAIDKVRTKHGFESILAARAIGGD